MRLPGGLGKIHLTGERVMSKRDFRNANGLINGLIPKGKPCPFKKECALSNERCPTKDNLKEVDFSCAAARAFSIMEGTDSTILRSIFDKRFVQ